MNKINTTTQYGGVELFNSFWKKYNVSEQFNSRREKKSGSEFSNIMKNISLGHILGEHTLEDIAKKSYKEELLGKNCKVSRWTYSRNMNSLTDNKQNQILMYLVTYIISSLKFSKKTRSSAVGLIDSSAIPLTGKTFENAQWVFDGRINDIVWGYEVMTLVIQIGKHCFPFQFTINDFSKQSIIEMANNMFELLGINKISMDGGIKGMQFYKELNSMNFKFYTKATKVWIYEKFCWFKSAEWWANSMRKFKRNHRYAAKKVSKDGLDFFIVVVKDDTRIFLTNDLKAKPKEVYDIYKRRWKIEESFREEKQNLGLEKLTVRKLNAIKTHILLIFVAYIFCQLVLHRLIFVDGIKCLVRDVFNHSAELIYSAEKCIVKFYKNFKYRRRIEYLLSHF